MDGWLEIGSTRLLLAVDAKIAERVENMSNTERMDLRYALSDSLRKAVTSILKK